MTVWSIHRVKKLVKHLDCKLYAVTLPIPFHRTGLTKSVQLQNHPYWPQLPWLLRATTYQYRSVWSVPAALFSRVPSLSVYFSLWDIPQILPTEYSCQGKMDGWMWLIRGTNRWLHGWVSKAVGFHPVLDSPCSSSATRMFSAPDFPQR